MSKSCLPIMDSCPPACAVIDSQGEDAKEKEKAGHAKAHLVDSGVPNQSFAVLPSVHLLKQISVEGDLGKKKKT